jgi:hypothetical protein
MMALNILIGAALLLFGRRLFWLFVAGVGFIVGMTLAQMFFTDASPGVIIAVAIGIGVVGALVSLMLQRLVLAIAGFFAGGYLLHALAISHGYETAAWIAFLVGGLLGVLLISTLFNWALIALSTLIGATVIVQNVPLQPVPSALLFLVLCAIGLFAQARPKSKGASAAAPPG